jgi:MoxR-like ATPase
MLKLRHVGVRASTIDDVANVASRDDVIELREEASSTVVHDAIIGYIAAIIRATRAVPAVSLGASPRAAVHLLAASKSLARLHSRDFVIPDDVSFMAKSVLRHRLMLRPEAELERYRPDDAVATALSMVPVPR